MSDQLPLAPAVGAIVRVRSRQYLVEEVTPPPDPKSSTAVRLSCLDDDAQGDALEVLWEREIDTEVVDASWETLGARGLDAPSHFAANLHTLRWHCVTATTPRLFQAPWRAGIEVMAYQLEPLRKALHLPRVNLFIADDVGLGKTIEAGLVLREMLLRQKVRRVVIAVPASVVTQWREELERRFGLTFVVHDREYVARMRRERGYAVNPWDTHSRFIISHSLLRDETYATPLRDWLGEFAPSSMLILDEAHHAAPASSAKYAIDSHFTRAVRDLAPRFEHRLFLSATPHNGLSNSFSALMEILDPQRFCRGVPIDPKLRDVVMVRRLKSDLRAISGGFPERKVVQVDLRDLDPATPELRLASLLDSYWKLREAQFETLTASGRAAMGLVLINLQKRLLSSIEAFARTLNAHRTSAARRRARKAERAKPKVSERGWRQRGLQLEASLAADDDSAELDDAEVEAEAEHTVGAASDALDFNDDEVSLLDAMADLAESSRKRADARIRWIDSRAGQFPPLLPASVETVLADDPADEVRDLPGGAYAVVLTHRHDLDLAIVEKLLRRNDFAYVGVIGSATKRARFEHRLRQRGIGEAALAALHCPIGVAGIVSKRPHDIAIAVAAALLQQRDRALAATGQSVPADFADRR